MKRVFILYGDANGCTYYRSQLPVKYCKTPLLKEGIELVGSRELSTLQRFDVYVFHRLLNPSFKSTLLALKDQGAKIVFDLDDDLWHIPPSNPSARKVGQGELDLLNWCLDVADRILVSTPELAEVVNRTDKTLLAPNLIDLEDFPERAANPNRVLWAGSLCHEEDVNLLVDPVRSLVEKLPQVEVFFFGYLPTGLASFRRIPGENLAALVPSHPRIVFAPPVPLADYFATLRALAPGIGLAPLSSHPFNCSKSCLKWLEYSACGAATIASNGAAYGPIAQRETGILTQDWSEVAELVQDQDERQRLAENAFEAVHFNHSWQLQSEKWLEIFRELTT